MSTKPVCPKCGGRMVSGSIRYVMESTEGQSMGPFATGFPMNNVQMVVNEVQRNAFWEEKTGKKTGLIFKNEETKQMRLTGFRCTLCNYIELYTSEK
ncbi:MAG: PF20097 family protein [Candidatus Bathyarchaeia archaeon]